MHALLHPANFQVTKLKGKCYDILSGTNLTFVNAHLVDWCKTKYLAEFMFSWPQIFWTNTFRY